MMIQKQFDREQLRLKAELNARNLDRKRSCDTIWGKIEDIIYKDDGTINWWKIVWNIGLLVARLVMYRQMRK